ncbi:uracil phosphoribosyltransferase [Stagonosporopsis vannaccii]|nr:uracil phosphoribosyltransferase [Stagonosporopsis vannaccii]
MGVPEHNETSPSPPSEMASSSSSSANNAMPAGPPPPPMPPPPYFKTHFINPSSFKSAVNSKVDKPLVSLFRLSVRILQLIFALASGISYGVELSHGNGRGKASGAFVFSQVTLGATLVILIINGVTVRYYRFSWMVDWILTVFWFALFAVFYAVYTGGQDMTPAYGGVNSGRMERAVWCDLINALLWFGSALFSSIMCCSGMKASIKGKIKGRRQRKQKQKMMETMGEMEMGTIRT